MESDAAIGSEQLEELEKRARETGISSLELWLDGGSAGESSAGQPTSAHPPTPEAVPKASPRSRSPQASPSPTPSNDALLAVANAPIKKSGTVTVFLFLFLNALGGPWWYLGKPISAIVMMAAYGFLINVYITDGDFLFPVLWVIDVICLSISFQGYKRRREEYLQKLIG